MALRARDMVGHRFPLPPAHNWHLPQTMEEELARNYGVSYGWHIVFFLLSKKPIYTTQRRSMQILRGDECVATNPRRRLSTATRTANDRLRCLSRCFHRLFFALLQTCRHADIAVFSAVSFFLDSPLLPWTVSDHSTMIHKLTSATNHGVYNSTSFESKR